MGDDGKNISKFSKKTAAKLQAIRRGTTIKLMGAVVQDTPVLSGLLRGNWNFAEGEPNLATSERTDKEGTSVQAEIEAGVLRSSGEKPVFLSNSLPYAYRIEFEGWSHTKAPEGMMRKNVARFAGLIKEFNG